MNDRHYVIRNRTTGLYADRDGGAWRCYRATPDAAARFATEAEAHAVIGYAFDREAVEAVRVGGGPANESSPGV